MRRTIMPEQNEATKETEYVLGTGLDELDRLAFPRRLWSAAAHAAWRRARIRIGQRVLDAGCGPGFASFDLAQIVTPRGAVVGVDESASFVAHLHEQAHAGRLPQLSAKIGDVQSLSEALADEAPFDIAYLRWVLCFVPDPAKVIHGIAAALKPGGRVVIHDYFHYESMTSAPKSTAHERAIAATMESWRARGGDTDVGGALPRLLATAGLRVDIVDCHARVARSSDTMFEWPKLWWSIYAPKLVDMGYLAAEDCEALLAHFRDLEASETSFIQCPTVYEFIATKV